jgi:hypothetical protein
MDDKERSRQGRGRGSARVGTLPPRQAAAPEHEREDFCLPGNSAKGCLLQPGASEYQPTRE